MNWLERARLEIQKSARCPTANSANRTLTAVMAVPHPAICEKLGVSNGSNGSMGAAHIQNEKDEERLEALLAAACRGVSLPDGSPFTPQWFRAQLDEEDIVGILEDDGPVLMLACFAMSFASRPWDLRHPSSSAHPERESVRCGDCQHFVADSINPPGGIGNCAIAGEGSRGLLYPFKYHECGDFTERVTRVFE